MNIKELKESIKSAKELGLPLDHHNIIKEIEQTVKESYNDGYNQAMRDEKKLTTYDR